MKYEIANVNRYTTTANGYILKYDEHVFVWFDEAGITSGAAPTFDEAERQVKNYVKSLEKCDYI